MDNPDADNNNASKANKASKASKANNAKQAADGAVSLLKRKEIQRTFTCQTCKSFAWRNLIGAHTFSVFYSISSTTGSSR